MVFQDEAGISWLWPILRMHGPDKDEYSVDMDAKYCKRRLDIAEAMEMGLARELVTDFMRPLRQSRTLWKFHIENSKNKHQYRLCSDDGQFLMCAKVSRASRLVEFFLYDPDSHERVLHDTNKSAFTMSCNLSRTKWQLVKERCDSCQYQPTHMSCVCQGKQEIACIRHSCHKIGKGINYCMDVQILDCGNSLHGLTCEAGPTIRSHKNQNLVTRLPEWNHALNSLVLDFIGRQVVPSAGNFQLVPDERLEHIVCQCGKIGPNTFGLDFMYPLTVVQAFGIAISAFLRAEQ